ncbi:MAG: hypothetical protein H7321_02435, partial [Bacteroidia bacterium]|nr:hypothetical protein [Bacteroidia bacterium]
LVIDMNRLYAYAKVVMENGQLKNFEPLEGLSKFASIEELNNVKFSRLENEVEIRDNMVIIPEMTVKNNILDMQIKGSHTFDNCMDYTIRLKVSDILASRYNWRKNRKQDEVEDHGKQGMIIYLTVKGTPGNLKFGITKVSLAPKLNLLSPAVKESVKQEKNELKQMLKDEFSRDPEKKQDKPKEEVVDWDE